MRSRCFGCSFLLFSFICSVALSQSASPRKEPSPSPSPTPPHSLYSLVSHLMQLKCTVKFQIQIQSKRRRLENLTGTGATPSPSPSPWDAPRQSWTTFRPSLSAATAAGSSKKRFAIATPSPMHTWLTCSLSRLLAPLSISFSIILVLVIPIITAITMLLLHQTAIMQPKSQYLLHLIALPRV